MLYQNFADKFQIWQKNPQQQQQQQRSLLTTT
jgi:hypothetical protein